MQPVGCLAGGWLVFVIFARVVTGLLICFNPQFVALLQGHVLFGDPTLFATYLFATAFMALLAIVGLRAALHFWLFLAILASISEYLTPNIPPWYAVLPLFGPGIVYLLLSFGTAPKGRF